MAENYIHPDDHEQGRHFISWIIKHFEEFILSPPDESDQDKCSKINDLHEIRKYQAFLSKYSSYNSPFRNILLYHGLGSGKTITTINLYNTLYNHNMNVKLIELKLLFYIICFFTP